MVTDPFWTQQQYGESPYKKVQQWYSHTKDMYRPSAGAALPQAPGTGDVGGVKTWGARGMYDIPDQDFYRSQISQGYGLSGAARGRQESMLGYLSALAEGKALGGGRKTLSQQAQEQSLSQIQAQSTAAARAGASPAERRMASYQGVAAGQQAAARGAIASMQEQQAAQKAVLQGAGQMRSQDIKTALAAQQGQLQASQATALQKQMEAKFLALGLTDREARRRANMQMEAMKLQAWEGAMGRKSAMDLLSKQLSSQEESALIGGGISAGASLMGALAMMAMMSDKTEKKDVEKVDMDRYLASCAGEKEDIAPVSGILDDPIEEEQTLEQPVASGQASGQQQMMQMMQQMQAQQAQMAAAQQAQAQQAQAQSQAQQMQAKQAAQAKKAKGVGGMISQAGQQLGGAIAKIGHGQMAGVQAGTTAQHKTDAQTAALFRELGRGTLDVSAADEPLIASDKRLKEEEQDIEDFMDALQAYKYRYKHPEQHGEGERIGVMAQDMEKSEVGRRMVVRDEEGTRHLDMDPKKTYPMVLAALADINKRMNRLEGEED